MKKQSKVKSSKFKVEYKKSRTRDSKTVLPSAHVARDIALKKPADKVFNGFKNWSPSRAACHCLAQARGQASNANKVAISLLRLGSSKGDPLRTKMLRSKSLVFCLLFSVFLLILLGAGVVHARAEVVSSSELIEHPKKYDGKEVIFQGEAVGDIMIRGDYAWISLNDDAYRPAKVVKEQKLAGYNSGHSIWIKKEEAQKITHLGSYRHAGDIVKVIGIFNRACTQHGGDMDIHGRNLDIVKRGYALNRPLEGPKGLAVLVLLILTLTLFLANRIYQKSKLD